ncbi:MAG: SMP-30/gluconolactonase/LRE family protein, partial [Myxococcales bacterium]|nr:SMP-30/gluconolactonase/LRE family protein [Myxococcales bacterium]
GAKPFVRKYTVAPNGDISAPAVFTTFGAASYPDGVTTDDDGNVFVATMSGVEVFKPDGSKWGVLAVPGGKATNVRHGGADRKTLFISTPLNVLKTTVKVAGRAD